MVESTVIALGIDIGGTNTKLGLVDRAGRVSQFQTFPTHATGSDPQPFLQNLSRHVTQVIALTSRPIEGIGVSAHGYIDDEGHGPVVCERTPALSGFDLTGWLKEQFHLPVMIYNDLTAHALAEYYFGCGRGTRRLMTLAVGTGIGIGVVVDGAPLRFTGGTSGDTGRLILDPSGPVCIYGVRGSAEAFCGTDRIEELAEQRYGKKVPAFQVIQAARQGRDPLAVEIIQNIGEHLGWALASLCSFFLPEKVALTGGTSAAGEVLLQACRNKFEEMVGDYHRILARRSGGYFRGVEIVLSQYVGESGLVGVVVEILLGNIARKA
jgi:predicted NBD/HSP70 family sugar kinase